MKQKDLLSSSTVGQVSLNSLKKPKISYLPVYDKLNTFPQHKMHSSKIRKGQYIKEYTFEIEHLCHNMMYIVLLHGDGKEKEMSLVFQFGQLFQRHPDFARNSSNAAVKDLVDLHADVALYRTVSAHGHTSRTKDLLLE